VTWQYVWRGGTPEHVDAITGEVRPATEGCWTKVPKTWAGTWSSSSDPDKWNTYAKVSEGRNKRNLTGIGFVFATPRDYSTKPPTKMQSPIERRKSDRLTGIDLDHCRDPATGVIEPWAQEIIDYSETYAEISPSEKGIRLFALGKIRSVFTCDDAGVEVYVDGRYLTVTGVHVAGTPDEIRPARKTIFALRERVRKFRGETAADAA
jgi:primase-polymerase (primpol)-like protein